MTAPTTTPMIVLLSDCRANVCDTTIDALTDVAGPTERTETPRLADASVRFAEKVESNTSAACHVM